MRWAAAGLLPADPAAVTAAVARGIRQAGFTGASWHLVAMDAWPLAAMREMAARLTDAGVALAQLLPPAHPSLVAREAERRRAGVEQMIALVRVARQIGAGNLYVRPGSLGAAHAWSTHPDNHRPETRERLVESLQPLARAAEGEGVILAIEGHVVSPLDTPEHTRVVIEAVGSPALRFNVDPVNYIPTVTDAYRSTDLLMRLFDQLGAYVVAAHAKDVTVEDRHVVHISEVVPGRGYLDHATFLRRFEAHCPDGFLIIEHLAPEQVPEARAYLGGVAAELGIAAREWADGHP
jgi:sugar phosphate isomerase/epimerase